MPFVDKWRTYEVTINSSTWTEVDAPFDCDYFVVANDTGVDVLVSSDGVNSKTLSSGYEFSLEGPRVDRTEMAARFGKDRPMCQLKTASGTHNIQITVVRA